MKILNLYAGIGGNRKYVEKEMVNIWNYGLEVKIKKH